MSRGQENRPAKGGVRGRLILMVFLLLVALLIWSTWMLSRKVIPAYFTGELLPLISETIGVRLEVESVEFNPFPTYLSLKGVSVYEENSKVRIARRVLIYPDLFPLIRKRLNIQMVEVNGFRVDEKVVGLIRFLREGGDVSDGSNWTVSVGHIYALQGEVSYRFENADLVVGAHSVSLDLDLPSKRLKMLTPEMGIVRGGQSVYHGNGEFILRNDDEGLEIRSVRLRGEDLRFDLSGKEQGGVFKGRINLVAGARFFMTVSGKGLMPDQEVNISGNLELPVNKVTDIESILKGLKYSLNAKGSIYLEDLMSILGETEPLRGRVSFEGTISGVGGKPVSDLDASMQKGHLYGVDTDSVRCRILYQDGRMVFKNGIVSAYGGVADVEVVITLPVVDWYSLDVKGRDLSGKALLKLVGWDPGIPDGMVKGWIHSEGETFQPEGEFFYEKKTDLATINEKPDDALGIVESIEGRFKKRGDRIGFDKIEVFSPFSHLALKGVVDLGSDEIEMSAVLSTTRAEEVVGIKGLDGVGVFRGRIDGLLSRPVINGTAELCKVRYEKTDLGCTSMKIQHNPGILLLNDGVLGREGWRFSFEGQIREPEKEILTFHRPDILLKGVFSDLPLNTVSSLTGVNTGFKGISKGEVEITGNPGAITISGNIEVQDLRRPGIDITGHMHSAFRAEENGVRLENLDILFGRSYIRGDVSLDKDVGVREGRLDYEVFPGDIYPAFPDSLVVKGKGSAGEGGLPGMGIFRGELLWPEEGGMGRLGKLNIYFKKGDIKIDGLFFDGLGVLKGYVRLGEDIDWSGSLSIKDGDYGKYLRYLFPELPDTALFSLSGEAYLERKRGVLAGGLNLRRVQFTFNEAVITNVGEVQLRLDEGMVNIKQMIMKAGPAEFTVTGALGFRDGYNVSVSGDTELGPLKWFLPGIEYLKGRAEFVLSITGKLDKPDLSGGVILERVACAVRGLPGRIKAFNGYAYIYHNRLILDGISFKYGGGDVEITGTGDVVGFGIRDFRLESRIRRLRVKRPDEFDLLLDGTASLIRKGKTVDLVGEVRVLEGVYRKDLGWTGIFIPERKVYTGVELPVPLRNVSLNLNLVGGEGIRINNNIINAPVSLDLVLTGTPENPGLLGRLELGTGKMFFRNNEFQILSASADFTDPTRINPYITVTATTRIRDYDIMLTLKGYPDQFDMSLSSDPILDEVDIISLLTIGKLGAEVKGIEGGVGVSEATQFLTGGLQDVLEERVRSLTGFDRILVEPYVSETTGKIGPKVTVSKRLLSDKLYVTYTTTIDEQPEQILKLEFILNRSTSLIGERDENGAVGADIKFRFEFR